MKASQFYISTVKEAPRDAELISHKLMIRAGFIKRLASGIYSWMPLGLKILRKIEKIVREEMNNANALEILMPAIQPAELWQESERWEFYGKELLRIKDRHQRDFCFGPTHEEVTLDIIRKDIKSYKQLPITLYQIQTKFRDEVRPRFGVMRAREFIMKDAYSFHTNHESLIETYNKIYQAYSNIFTRLGLKFRAVAADTGAIGGTGSHEFQVLTDSGEDIIAYSDSSNYAANIELATYLKKNATRTQSTKEKEKIATPNQKTCFEVAKMVNAPLSNTVKSLVYDGVNNQPVLVLIRGDHELNEIKIGKIAQLKQPLTFSTHSTIEQYFKCSPGFIGPVDFKGIIIADNDVSIMSDFICGANIDGFHYINVNFGRDCPEPTIIADIRNVIEGDPSPDGNGTLKLCRGIEVGHVFQLRTKYSTPMNLTYLDQNGKSQLMEMGCYGIGVSRIIAAAIEQNNDEKGIIFPVNMAPFELIITSINYSKSTLVKTKSDELYIKLKNLNIDVLLDDRDERIGSLLADSELLGIPFRIVIGEKFLANNQVEFYNRKISASELINLNDIVNIASELINLEKK